ncbi:hypothetical protein BJ138DRAFT_1118401 [Hygrophoropsis aurantiaca]|uniref:Uncharacterized protein n=1 Tax=Hygrophoropsis aurantiaca TaxID=72124 RepID=A0ACB7ZWR3_9AGAM|nr:hypothetical protein BJ138DRAFT_1118401 [Hygrophoropsis aurantiaca]
MTARRQSSTTSLAKFARTSSPDTSNRSLDFCNAFWGVGDGGVDVLFARMRGAARTMEELRNFWKERSAIEEDYAKRLAKLSKMSIGKDEIGELRNSVDTLRLETDKQASHHLRLAQQLRSEMEGQAVVFLSKQAYHKKTYQAAIEKEFKVKQTREQHASKAREKYESDCLRINSYTAQSTLVQGKDLEKIHLKLERAQQTVQVNENDYAQFTRVLQETMQKWELDWKAFCDSCQDLEEERMEFMKDNMWAYANAVSTVCVSDDESCEQMRLALEQLEPDKDMENFVRDYGTGNAIPEPPTFVNYTSADAPPPSSTRTTTRPAVFARSTQRTSAPRNPPAASPEIEPVDDTNHAGVGAGGRGSAPPDNTLSRSNTSRSQRSRSQTNGIPANGHSSPANGIQRRPSNAVRPEPRGDPVDPTVSGTMLVIGNKTFEVDPNKDPQQQLGHQVRTSPPIGEQNDPLVQQMANLTTAVANGPTRRPTVRRDAPSSGDSRRGTGESLNTPSTAGTNGASRRDYRNSAEVVVGSYPLAPSRSTSPNPPRAALAGPPQHNLSSSTSNVNVEEVVSGYQRPFPGEPRSRRNSSVGLTEPPPNQHAVSVRSADQNGVRPTSAGYTGIGTGQSLTTRQQSPPGAANPGGQQYIGYAPVATTPVRAPSISQRPVTPNTVGIALGSDGRVLIDNMVPQRQISYGQTPGNQPYSGHPDNSRAVQPRNDYGPVVAPPPPPPQSYGQPPQAQVTSYSNYSHPPQPAYDSHQAVTYQPPPPPSSQPNYGYGPPAPTTQFNPPAANPTYNQQGRYYDQNGRQYRAPSPAITRSPSPQPPRGPPPPTGAYTDDGRPILFYVKALYDYSATIDEEFDFQSGDIIAVTDTPEDGWWSGELLDEARRQAGRHVFPSNFVCLF